MISHSSQSLARQVATPCTAPPLVRTERCFHHLSISAARKHVERDLHFAPITLPDTSCLQHLALLHPSSTRHTDAVSIIDALVIPTDISPGPYVLGFRYDCEATAQVWSSCADIEIA